ncbi:hypothetical protein D9619_008562 [Psilocybe cf. subviscida]|uniref:Uncharacterized protein n=1 Tax=Psilocybe cf. subviscida TaxID=2480587 RepID=A0A8H5F0Y9_9AGAR|nr:hypothetical protein D9619_008562 [Psilocybe cf. subviscida]
MDITAPCTTLTTSLYQFNYSTVPMFLKTTKELSDYFAYNRDMSGGDYSPMGVGFVKASTRGGKGFNSSSGYVAQLSTHPDLTVCKLLHTRTSFREPYESSCHPQSPVQLLAESGLKIVAGRSSMMRRSDERPCLKFESRCYYLY